MGGTGSKATKKPSAGGSRPAWSRRGTGRWRAVGWAPQKILARHGDIDALFAASDLMALGAMAALREAGKRVPEDVAVAGFDDSVAATLADPPLTTVRHPCEDIAMEALRILDDHMEGRSSEPEHVVLPTEFVRRKSA